MEPRITGEERTNLIEHAVRKVLSNHEGTGGIHHEVLVGAVARRNRFFELGEIEVLDVVIAMSKRGEIKGGTYLYLGGR